MCDVLFVVPADKPIITNECFGTLLLATILQEKGLNVEIYRYYEASRENGYCSFVEESVRNILGKTPSVVSFYCRCDYYFTDIQIAKGLKELRPELPIVFGGPQADLTAVETITEIPWVDYCCSGEGENTVYPLFSSLINGKDVSNIAGLTYRDRQGKVVSNPRPELLSDFESLPYIDYSFVPANVMQDAVESGKYVTVPVGRGCPFNCAYCSTSVFWKRRFRITSPERIVSEMKRLNEQYEVTCFNFDHDLFTANKNRVMEFCRVLKESGLKAKWRCASRIDTIDEEMVSAMVDAGMSNVYVGIETGSERMQKLTHKNLKLDDIRKVIRMLLKHNLELTTSFMYGFPEETEDDVEKTAKLAYELYKMNVRTFQFHLCTIMPATEYYNRYRNELEFSTYVSDVVCGFGLEENVDFLNEHKEVFPSYFEYKSPLRDKLVGFDNCFFLCLELYDILGKLEPQRFENTRLVDLFYSFRDANLHFLQANGDRGKIYGAKWELFGKYLETVYSGIELQKMNGIFEYLRDCEKWRKASDVVDVHKYPVNIGDYISKKTLADIRISDCIVYFNKINGKGNITVSQLPTM